MPLKSIHTNEVLITHGMFSFIFGFEHFNIVCISKMKLHLLEWTIMNNALNSTILFCYKTQNNFYYKCYR